MKGRPQDFMRVGIIHFMTFPEVMKGDGSAVETLKTLCADDYFQAIEVTRMKYPDVRARAIKMVRKSGKTVTFGAEPLIQGEGLDLNSLDVRTRQAAVDVMRECLAEAVEWKAEAFTLFSGPDPGESKRETAMTWLCASLKEICEFSRRSGGPPVVLAQFDRSKIGRNWLIGPTAEAVNVAQMVAGIYLRAGLLVDLSHLPLLGEKPDDAIQAAAPFLRCAHMGNCVMRDKSHPAYGDNHPIFGIPEGENGVDELAAFLKALLGVGFIGEGKRNNVFFNIKPFGDQTPDDIIANAKQTLDAAWKIL